MRENEVIAGKYRLVALLGQGGMGSVWRAQHLGLNAPVAVKLIDPALAGSGEGLARFLREAQAAAALRSPHVVQVLDHGVDAAINQPFIVMEMMEGESLASRIAKSGPLSPLETARVVSHIARALTRAHAAGIVHRDLKPDNVFLVNNEDEEIAKVLDFGIAKSDAHQLGHGSATQTGAVMGTPYYMSPEQISGSKAVDFRTDLWALGVIACECVTGRRPFDAETIGGLALKICAEAPPRPSSFNSVPSAFDAWFARATARERDARFQSARELSDSLRAACSSPGLSEAEPARAPASLPAPRLDTASPLSVSRNPLQDDAFAPRPKSRAALVAVLTLAAVAAGGGLWWRASGPETTSAVTSAAPPASPTQTLVAPTPGPPQVTAEPAPAVVPSPAASTDVAKAPSVAPVAAQRARAVHAEKSKKGAVKAEPAAAPMAAPAAVKAEPPARSNPANDVLDERR